MHVIVTLGLNNNVVCMFLSCVIRTSIYRLFVVGSFVYGVCEFLETRLVQPNFDMNYKLDLCY